MPTRKRKTAPQAESIDLRSEFASRLPLPEDLAPQLGEALRHILAAPGSLVRPRIVMQMAMAYGTGAEGAKELAIALEYFHTASLVFDDLPCMDNAAQRRGLPCAHVAFGEAGAILAALALINRAYALTWKAVARCAPSVQTGALGYIEKLLGAEGLLGGQSRDLNYARLPHDGETNRRIACGKTVSLIRLSLVLPAMLGDAPRRELQLLERLAMYWGLSYQIADDLKDVIQTEVETGKTVARDELLDRPNTAIALGVLPALARLNRLIALGDRTMSQLLSFRPATAFLGSLRAGLQEDVDRIGRGVRDAASPRSA
jgi:geranylgeranyl pyrophosphate synthase